MNNDETVHELGCILSTFNSIEAELVDCPLCSLYLTLMLNFVHKKIIVVIMMPSYSMFIISGIFTHSITIYIDNKTSKSDRK